MPGESDVGEESTRWRGGERLGGRTGRGLFAARHALFDHLRGAVEAATAVAAHRQLLANLAQRGSPRVDRLVDLTIGNPVTDANVHELKLIRMRMIVNKLFDIY